jgi:RNA polymerase sigma factor (sigma-70 family)
MADGIPIQFTSIERPFVEASAPGWQFADVRSLTGAISRGDENAFNFFYAEYSPRVFRLLIVVTGGDEHLSRELHQWVMIKAAQRMRVFETEAQLWAWLAQVARNKWRDLWRTRTREAKALDLMAGFHAEAAPERSEPLQEAVARLSENERQLLESFYLEHVPQKQISRRTGRSVKAIQCSLARIRKQLKDFIEEALKR